jgi:hypothetical protein
MIRSWQHRHVDNVSATAGPAAPARTNIKIHTQHSIIALICFTLPQLYFIFLAYTKPTLIHSKHSIIVLLTCFTLPAYHMRAACLIRSYTQQTTNIKQEDLNETPNKNYYSGCMN